MATSSQLIAALKKHLRERGLHYRELATALGLSESAVKRMFATGNMSLRRVDDICAALGMDLSDLLVLLDRDTTRVDGLSEDNERKLVDNPRLLLMAYCIVNRWEVKDVLARYEFSEAQAMLALAELDRMKMIELLPGNRVKTLVGNNFNWQPNGPIEVFFRSQVQSEFFSGAFAGDGDLHLVKNGDISRVAQSRLIDRLQSVGNLFDDITRDERRLAPDQRHGTTMVLAIRHWRYAAFRQFEREVHPVR